MIWFPFFKQFLIEAARQVEGMVDDYVIFWATMGHPAAKKIQVPVAFWHSKADHIVPIRHAEYLASLIPNAELHRMQDYDHTGSVLAVQLELYDFFNFRLRVRPFSLKLLDLVT